MGYRLNRLDEPVFIAVSKPLLTEFGFHLRLESCDQCSLMQEKHTGICHGDSGGPLVCKNQLVGIASTVWESKTLDCATGYPDIYTSVPALKNWIKKGSIANENHNKRTVKK